VDRTNRNTALASAMVEELARCGVREAVLSPGSRSTPLALALRREPAIETRVIVDERSAGFFALGAAQASGVPVAVLCTSGTAAANLHPAVCEADEAAVPLIVLTADRPPELRAIGAGQTIDQLKLYGSAVRWFFEVGTHEADDAGLLHFRSVACRAFAVAAGDPRPGPVHLNVAWRDPLGPEPGPGDLSASTDLAVHGRGERPLTSVRRGVAAPPDAAGELAHRIGSRPRGLIVAGRNPDPALAAPLAALARVSGYPVLAEPTSQLRFGPHDRDLVVTRYGPIAEAAPEVLEPELVIRFGDLPTSKPLRRWLAKLATEQWVVDGRYGWNEPSRVADAVVRAEAPAFAADVAGWVPEGSGVRGWSELWLAADAAADTAIEAELAAAEGPTEPGAHAALGRLYADGELVYTASSMPIRDQESFAAGGPAAVRFLCNRGANGIDGLVSSGIGAAVATGSATWIVTGDLGLFHDMNGLAALRHAEAPVRVVVLNNDGGGIFEFLPQAGQIDRDEFEALLGTPLGLDLERVADVHGVRYERVTELSRLADAGRETALIEIPVERAGNVALHARLGERARGAIADAIANG
jgi:2-succinyl-5-enolpyruvyl-6-hydroxy-3-cyclohexene-1-carboxylate synthase